MAVSVEAREALVTLAEHFPESARTAPGKMLSAPSLTVINKAGAAKGFVFATSDRLIMKLPRLRIDMLEGEGMGKRMVMANRQMKEWISLPVDDPERLVPLAQEARDFVASLSK